jgi:hypothetical protein
LSRTVAGYRCSRASLDAGEDLAGTASTVRAFLLVEAPGAWGTDALRASLLPLEVRRWLHRVEREHRVRPLMIRRDGRPRHDGAPVHVFAAHAGRERRWLEHAVLDDHRALLDLDVSGMWSGRSAGLPAHDEPLFAVCTHGRHDACCAERGRPVWEALRRADPEHAWQVSHIGGDRYAANVLVLPDGLYYGRMEAHDAGDLVAAHRRGEVLLDRLRGRCAYPMPVQHAEIHLRRTTGVRGLDALRLVSHERADDVTRAVFEVAGERHEVHVRTSRDEARQLTCAATRLSPPVRHSVLD